jgi:hypothetical protein
MAYSIEGNYFENCSCNVACPCGASNLTEPASYERCNFLMIFEVTGGDVDGVDVGGTTVGVFGDTPALMAEGQWKVGLVIDEAANDEQREALTSVFSGSLGGPPELIAGLLGEMLGVEYASIEVSENGRTHSVRIGDSVDMEIEDFAGAEEGDVMELHNIGHPANSVLTLAKATKSKINLFGYELALEGRNGHAAPFSWAG